MFEKFKGANTGKNKIEPKSEFIKFPSSLKGKSDTGRSSSKYQVEKLQRPRPKKTQSIPPDENKVNSIKKYFVALPNRAENLHPTDGSQNHPALIQKRFGDKCDYGTTDSSNKNQKRILETVFHQSEKTKLKNSKEKKAYTETASPTHPGPSVMP